MNLNLTVPTRYGLNVLGVLGGAVALYLGAPVLVPLTIAVLLATILHPAATWLKRRLAVPWFFACLAMILLLVVLHLAVFSAVAVSIPQLVNKLPATDVAWEKKYEDTVRRMHEAVPFLTDVLPARAAQSSFYRTVKSLFSPENVSNYVQKLAGLGLDQLAQMVLIVFVTLFLMLEGELLAGKVRAVFGTGPDTQRRVAAALADTASAIRTYLVWRTVVNIGLAVVLGAFYKFVVRLEQWYLWAVLTAVLGYVPYIGTIAAGIPPILEALVFGDRPEYALGVFVFYVGLVTVEGYLIVPWVMGRGMDLNATTVMVACLFWNLVWGVAGLFLAMPLMAAAKAVLRHAGWPEWGDLLSAVETTPAAPADGDRTETVGRPAGRHRAGGDEATVVLDSPFADGPGNTPRRPS